MAADYLHINSTSPGVSITLIFYDEVPVDEDMRLTISLHFPIKFPELGYNVSSTRRPLSFVLLAESRRLCTLDLVAPTQIWRDFANIPLSRLPLLPKVDGTLLYIHDFFLVIQRCPNVSDIAAEVHFTDGSHNGGGSDAMYMPRLCKLEVSPSHLLDAITAPSSTSLIAMNKSFIRSSSRGPTIVDFISQSGSSLTDLELHRNSTAGELFDSVPWHVDMSSPYHSFHNNYKVAFDTRMKSLSSVLPKRDLVVCHQKRLARNLNPFPDAIPAMDVIESMLADGKVESINVGLILVNVSSEGARE
ncbi:hypothetical protein F5146DRAFT_1006822 [Armillaria mellea]|nr:hypothetical protein F5146DRAFT_1006822 [Armillaria mellea]